jgi:hypothetical protein
MIDYLNYWLKDVVEVFYVFEIWEIDGFIKKEID